jgi:ribosomal protein S27E
MSSKKEKVEDGEVNQTADLPLTELYIEAEARIAEGYIVFFKFTCEQCHARLTFSEPNTLYTDGECDKCGHVTHLKYGGFLIVKRVGGKP